MVDLPLYSKVARGIPVKPKLSAGKEAQDWFRDTVVNLKSTNIYKLFEGARKNLVDDINISSIGTMLQFIYDPKTKEKLPYYDIHPLIFVVEMTSNGFTGINLHYLPPYHRAKLMEALRGIALKEKDKMKLQISYTVLKSASKFSLFKPCYKRYLNDHVQSRFFLVEPDKWDTVMMLPLQRFVKKSETEVWKDSIGR